MNPERDQLLVKEGRGDRRIAYIFVAIAVLLLGGSVLGLDLLSEGMAPQHPMRAVGIAALVLAGTGIWWTLLPKRHLQRRTKFADAFELAADLELGPTDNPLAATITVRPEGQTWRLLIDCREGDKFVRSLLGSSMAGEVFMSRAEKKPVALWMKGKVFLVGGQKLVV